MSQRAFIQYIREATSQSVSQSVSPATSQTRQETVNQSVSQSAHQPYQPARKQLTSQSASQPSHLTSQSENSQPVSQSVSPATLPARQETVKPCIRLPRELGVTATVQLDETSWPLARRDGPRGGGKTVEPPFSSLPSVHSPSVCLPQAHHRVSVRIYRFYATFSKGAMETRERELRID